MGLTVSGTITMSGGFLSPIGNAIAFIRANIDESLLKEFDIPALMKQFPNDISKAGSMVSFKGPVAIINSVTSLKITIAALIALLGVGICYGLHKAFGKKDEKFSVPAAVAIGIVAGVVTYFSPVLRNFTPGVYFFGR